MKTTKFTQRANRQWVTVIGFVNMAVASIILKLIFAALLVKCIQGFDPCDFIECGPTRVCKTDRFGFLQCVCGQNTFEYQGICVGNPCETKRCGLNRVCEVSKSTGLAECVCEKGYSLATNLNRCIQCPTGKTFISCAPSCQKTCDSVISGKPPFCPGNRFVCRPNVHCICPRGYVEKSSTDSTCVRESKCKVDPCRAVRCIFNRKCVEGKCVCNEGFVKKGFFCIPDLCTTIKCPRNSECKDGACVCYKGYEFNSNRRCVKVSEKCVSPKVSTACAVQCPATCENPVPKGRCRTTCDKNKKCVCRRGMLERSSTDSTCVRPSDCTAKCPSPKVPTQCATFCPATCENLRPTNCIFACNTRKKCVCPSGMVERSSSDTTCVPISACSTNPCSNCPSNSRCIDKRCICNIGFVFVGGRCVIDVCRSCPTNSKCVNQACVCNDGFVRVAERCIPDPCGNCPANSRCSSNRCVCNPPFVMRNGRCILPDDPCQNCPDNSKCVNDECVCDGGFRKAGDDCVPAGCPSPKIYTACASTCPKTCKTKDHTFPTSCGGCRPDVNCVCPTGWVETHFGDSTCVRESSCPAQSPCDFIRCHENSVCDRNARACVCRDGYRPAGFRTCRRI